MMFLACLCVDLVLTLWPTFVRVVGTWEDHMPGALLNPPNVGDESLNLRWMRHGVVFKRQVFESTKDPCFGVLLWFLTKLERLMTPVHADPQKCLKVTLNSRGGIVQGKHVESNPYPRSNHDMQLHKI
jgi:hypothetical protein